MNSRIPPSDEPPNAVRVRGLRKKYGDIEAVKNVSLDVAVGEIFALLGPNGAGKTTTIEILTGQRQRTGGEVMVLGLDPHHADAHHRAAVGVVPQSASDFDELRLGEVVAHFATYYPRPRSPVETLELVGLAQQRSAAVKTLSGGQRRRLDVALGIIGRPTLLFLDEPTIGFDPAARRDFWALIRQLAAGGTTVMLTTHYLEEAEALADRVGVLVGGELVAFAAPAELGGRAEGEATVRWLEDGQYRHVLTSQVTKLIRELAVRFPEEIPHLTVTRPSLEDSYLAMVRDAGVST